MHVYNVENSDIRNFNPIMDTTLQLELIKAFFYVALIVKKW